MEEVDCIVIGAGVVGLAVARALALAGREVFIVESLGDMGSITSARNSEVIHAGIYYPQGSLKARLCVQGRDLLYRYCEENHIAHARCGKLIVATSETQKTDLQRIATHAAANGVSDLRPLSRGEARVLEPQLECIAALLSPSTGIVDSHGVMQQMLADAEGAGAAMALKSEVVSAEVRNGGLAVEVQAEDGESMWLQATLVVNAAGLAAPRVASCIKGLPEAMQPQAFFSKGNYFSLAAKAPFSRLIYPVPEPGGLGVHLTLDIAGQARFGPDVEWLDIVDDRAINYHVDGRRADGFYALIRRYWPGLPDGALQPSYSGVRPKLSRGKEADFVIQGPANHGVAGLVNLFGIESPGLTASLAIGQHVLSLC